MEMKMDGVAEFTDKLIRVYDDARILYKRAAYDGAKVLADEIKKGLHGLRVVKFEWNTPENPRHGVTQQEKDNLIESMGVSRIDYDGGMTSVSIGFDGYWGRPTKRYPKGIPNQMIMRAVESGTSFMTKQPVIRKAVNKCKKEAERTMEHTVTDFINERLK